ncbi:tetratricopeptide repeat protein [uncultured Vibrio sp.]|uniref:tetratricopeptide repeat protein n=1 Tax=uncultured Vibrio sp. TaxID=114054 RepID=UPI0025EAD2A3|nr:tetratricopeptide repeat protein [uncultured Vibrio sp.]
MFKSHFLLSVFVLLVPFSALSSNETLTPEQQPERQPQIVAAPYNSYEMTKEAAESGLVHAQVKLAMMYEQGEGTSVDLEEAAFWYRLAANEDHLEAQYNLALLHLSGLGVVEDSSAALYWIERAATQGYMPAIIHLSIYSEFGELTNNTWVKKAAQSGDVSARMLLADFHLSQGDSEENFKIAEYWLWRVAKQGIVEAQIKLVEFYLNPKYGRVDKEKSAYWRAQINSAEYLNDSVD